MSLENLIAAMSEPAFYPHRPASVEFRQTHISCVFLAGEYVYKIKKPLHLAFLDYSTLERRFHFCREEVRLNRRLTQRVYLGVYPIVRRGGGFALGADPIEQPDPNPQPDPNVVEYAVKMRRLPDDRSLERLIGAGQLDPAVMERIARIAAKFHAGAGRGRSTDYGAADALAAKMETELEECRPFIGDTIGEREFDAIGRFNRAFIERHRDLLDRRAQAGMVREGHGDLRAEHICVTDQIDIIDCVEFSEALRYGDIASDLSFLLMDLDRLQAPALGHDLLSAYKAEIGDGDLSRLLNFYKCFRALVRGKVGSIKARAAEVLPDSRQRARESARAYFAAAHVYARAGSPVLIVLCGLPASGKSTIAQALAERGGFAVFNSDVVRKRRAGKAPTERAGGAVGQGLYSHESSAATYLALAQAAADALRAGDGVIIDATYKDAAERSALREVARAAGAPIVFAECVISAEEAKRRLAARALDPKAVSDATWEVYLQHQAAFAPFGPESADCHLRLDGAAHPAAAAREIERFIASI
jgi:uncharacterized protein